MATQGCFKDNESFKKLNAIPVRTTIETAFYGNNVVEVPDLKTAYELARKSPGTVELDGMPVYRPLEQGLPKGANVLLFNDGTVVGRFAGARKIVGYPDVDIAKLSTVVREAVYNTRYRTLYRASAIVGLEEDFMARAHLLLPQGFENNLYSWLFNFQVINEEYRKRYAKSRPLENDGDIFVFADPEFTHPDFPMGLAFFSPEQNCAAVLGMRYFGELKKGTLTLAWGIGARNGYASCHAGIKRYGLKKGGRKFVLAVFGLSGSGKSTITHSRHSGQYDITVLHDDAFVVNIKEKYAIALEPAYFDKVQDYPMGCEDNKYLVTMQNCGVTVDKKGHKIAVTEDIRNGNGRAMKSKFWSPNRIDRIDEPLNAICWLMKDPTLPPVLKLTGPSLASVMGATLATKRTTAERLAPGVDPNALVIESYANPFRTYPLEMDYTRFRDLIADGVDCYILNTGDFMGQKVQPKHTLGALEAIVEGRAKFVPFGKVHGIEMMPFDDFKVDFGNAAYLQQLYERFIDRVKFIASRETDKGGMDKLPADALNALKIAAKDLEGMGAKPLPPSPEEKMVAATRTVVAKSKQVAEESKKIAQKATRIAKAAMDAVQEEVSRERKKRK